MKRFKIPMRILSIILAVMFVSEILPFSVWAKDLDEKQSVESAEVMTENEEKSPILGEVIEERDACKKVFERKDGSYTAILSPDPVHYYDNGEWVEIDNTLEENNGVIINASNSFSVNLPSEITDDKNITVSNGSNEISFKMTDITSSDASIAEQTQAAADETSELMGLGNINSSVEYADVMANTNLVYDINAECIKESIVLDSCPESGKSYTYIINANGGSLSLNSDNSVNVVKNDETVFVIESPYMFDGAGATTSEVSVALTDNGDATYTLTYTPDAEWLSSSERSYPVTIDPTTRVLSAREIANVQVGTCSASESDLETYYYLEKDATNSTQLYYSYPNSMLNNLSLNVVVTSAELSVYCQATKNDDTIAAYMLNGSWDASTTTAVKKFDRVLDYNTIPYGANTSRYVWDVTEAAHKWSINYSENYGIALMAYNDNDCNTRVNRMLSSTNSWDRPWFELDYVLVDSAAEYDTETVDMGRAGTFYLNKYTGTFYVKRTDLSLNGNVMPVNVGLTYNPWSYASGKNLYNGGYWLFDYFNKIFYSYTEMQSGETRHVYTLHDSGGVITKFFEVLPTDSDYETVPSGYTADYLTNYTRYKAACGNMDKCLWVPKTDTTYKDFANMIIEDTTYRYTIDSINRITSITNKTTNDVIPITFGTSTSNSISVVTDGVGRKYTFIKGYDASWKPVADKLEVYNSDNNRININTLSGSVAVGVDYEYQAVSSTENYLTSVTYADGEQVSYTYNSDGLMTSMTNVDGSKLSIRYHRGRVLEYTKYFPGNIFESSFSIGYNSASQRTFTYDRYDYDIDDVIVTVQRYNSLLQKVGSISSDSGYSYSKYENQNDTSSELLSYSASVDSATNLITNGEFSSMANWTAIAPAYVGVGDNILRIEEFMGYEGNSLRFVGKISQNARVYQTIPTLEANGSDDVYTASAWSISTLSSSANKYVHDYGHVDKTYALCVLDSEGNVLAQYDYDTCTSDWQFGAVSFKTTENLSNIKVALIFDNQPESMVYFTDVKLFKSNAGYVFTENEDSSTSGVESGVIAETITVDGVTYRTSPCDYCSCAQCTTPITVSYNGENTTVYYNCACDDEDATCNCLSCRQERGSSSQSNETYGLPLSESQSNGTKTLTSSSNTYTSDYNYLATSVDSSGNTVYYNYNADTGLLDSYSDTSAVSNLVNYTYNGVGALEQVSQAVSGLSSGTTMTAGCTYSGDKITSMSHNGTVYFFKYNNYGNLTNIKVAGSADNESTAQSIVAYGYNGRQQNNKITYGNGTVITYSYDDKSKNLTQISYSTGQKYTYEYNTDGDMTAAYDYSNSIASIYTDGVLSSMKLFSVTDGEIVLGNEIYSVSTNDDGIKTETAFGSTITTAQATTQYISSTDSVKTTQNITLGENTLTSSTTEDFFGRTTGSELELIGETGTLSTLTSEYSYADTDATASGQVTGILNKQSGTVRSNYTYTYDVRGNITGVSNNGTLINAYTYDEAGQVTTEYNYATHKATTYLYDANGNIASKTPYTDVTSSDLTTATQGTTISYGYTDSNWSDKLTSYDGQTITYDASGNPTSYRGKTITWNGRLMTSYTTGTTRYEFGYNDSGLRTTKRVYENDVLTQTTTYLWADGRLTSQKIYTHSDDVYITFNYLYDNNGEAIGFEYDGLTLFYVKNLQGDVVKILGADGNNVALNMSYDAWGQMSISAGGSDFASIIRAISLAVMNNIAYRGYFFDYEIGLYYLQSRYYDPEVGRFINADDTNYLGYDKSPISYNLFAYCKNNPVNYADYIGFQPSFAKKISRWYKDSFIYRKFFEITQKGKFRKGFDLAGFFRDSKGIYHAKKNAPQRVFGYNNFYDFCFNMGTSMEKKKYPFQYNGEEYVIWVWKGDYLNLGAGTELGIYYGGEPHWKVDTNLAMPMALFLYYNNKCIINYYPDETQWWITGFNPSYQNILAESLFAQFVIEFSNRGMYYAFLAQYAQNSAWDFGESGDYFAILSF